MGRPFCKNFLILVKCPRDSRKEFDWFRCEKVSHKLKYLNFNTNRPKDIFSSRFIRFTTLRVSHAKIFAGDKREWKSGYKLFVAGVMKNKLRASELFIFHNSDHREFIKPVLQLFCFAQRLSFPCDTQKRGRVVTIVSFT